MWLPHVTVASIIENDGKFLLVEEYAGNKEAVFNQPAGHLDPNESLIEAAIRETFEETAWNVEIEGFVGVALYTAPSNGVTYQRNTFYGKTLDFDPHAQLDEGIIAAHWLTYEEILAKSDKMRSHLVARSIEQYLNGHRYPLDLLY